MKLHHQLKKTAGEVIDALSDMQTFVRVHPVIYRADPLSNRFFRVYEKLKFGFFPLTFSYTTEVVVDRPNKCIIMHAAVMKIVKITIHFVVNETPEGSEVIENITFKSWLPVHPFMKAIFKKQHRQLFLNLGQLP